MNKGASLVEVLVVIAIILILLGIVVWYPPRSSLDLDRAARQLASDLRRAQNMAMAAEEQGGVVPVSYGLQFPTFNLYSVWYRIPPNTVIFQMVYPPTGITIINPSPGFGQNIVFRVPDGAICISDNIDCTDSLPFTDFPSQSITFRASNGSTKTVTITSAGKIEIQ